MLWDAIRMYQPYIVISDVFQGIVDMIQWESSENFSECIHVFHYRTLALLTAMWAKW
jgi:hypothetical protein